MEKKNRLEKNQNVHIQGCGPPLPPECPLRSRKPAASNNSRAWGTGSVKKEAALPQTAHNYPAGVV